MKIAIIISGQIRQDFKKSYDEIEKNILKNYDCDIFISTWEGEENLDEMISLYKPKKINIENFENVKEKIQGEKLDYKKEHQEVKIDNVLYMWYKINDSFKLIDNPHEYDFIIKTRFDLITNHTFPDLNRLDKNKLYIPNGWNWRGGINDLMGFGNSENMSYYCSLYDYIPVHYNNGCTFHPESLLRFHLIKGNINIERIYIEHFLRQKTFNIMEACHTLG